MPVLYFVPLATEAEFYSQLDNFLHSDFISLYYRTTGKYRGRKPWIFVKIQPLLPYYCCASGTYRLNFRENSSVNNVLSALQAYEKSDSSLNIIFYPLTSQLPPLNCHLSTVTSQLSTINSQCVSLVSACVTLWNVAHPLFIGAVSACQPYFQILVYVFSADRHPLFIVNVGIYTHSHLFNNYRYFLNTYIWFIWQTGHPWSLRSGSCCSCCGQHHSL